MRPCHYYLPLTLLLLQQHQQRTVAPPELFFTLKHLDKIVMLHTHLLHKLKLVALVADQD